MQRLTFIRNALKKHKQHLFPFSLAYLLVMVAFYAYIYNGNPLQFYTTYSYWHTLPFTILTLCISAAIGVTLVLFIEKLRELKAQHASLSAAGIGFGVLAAGCPGCLFGIFPLFLGFFGITGTLAVLPLNGLEFQFLALLFLGVSIYMLAEKSVCQV
ncbi:MAG: hypothetical protein OXR66_00760 [Candidatus Woesearchaeota archaeon]|nr:hypothetical protein [Candidatus Woesearchaeota archaeon]